jgi:hypothetical protein
VCVCVSIRLEVHINKTNINNIVFFPLLTDEPRDRSF